MTAFGLASPAAILKPHRSRIAFVHIGENIVTVLSCLFAAKCFCLRGAPPVNSACASGTDTSLKSSGTGPISERKSQGRIPLLDFLAAQHCRFDHDFDLMASEKQKEGCWNGALITPTALLVNWDIMLQFLTGQVLKSR